MTEISSVTATSTAPQPVAAPVGRHFAYVLQGLIGAQLAPTSAVAPEPAPAALPAGIPTGAVTVGPNGPTTIGAFRFWHRVLPVGADA
ncbi:hypothetical protein [Cryptosporangium sp. NPDC048952]|uniref:hypothetical protein n=1 Tax=Cryptosporangium sp. NPDC048952 TaxID=3363961 RepID=UPI00371FB619